MSIEIIDGDFGHCIAELNQHGLVLPHETIHFADIAEIAVGSLDMVHGPAGAGGAGMPLGILFGGVYPVASTSYSGNSMEIAFTLTTQTGKLLVGKTDSDTFARLREAYFPEE